MSGSLKSVKVKQNIVWYHETNDNSDRTFLALHGYSTAPSFYAKNTKAYQKYATVIQPRIFGFKYFKNQPITVDEHTEFLMHFLETDAIKDRCTVMGHSYGGAVGIKMSQQGHEKINGVLSINPALKQDYGIAGLIAKGIAKTLNEMAGIAIESEYHPARLLYETMVPVISCMRKDKETTKAQLKDMLDVDYSGNQITAPTRILYGTNDELFDMKDSQIEAFQDIGLTDIRFLKGFNHDWPLLNPKRCLEEILDFLREVESKQ